MESNDGGPLFRRFRGLVRPAEFSVSAFQRGDGAGIQRLRRDQCSGCDLPSLARLRLSRSARPAPLRCKKRQAEPTRMQMAMQSLWPRVQRVRTVRMECTERASARSRQPRDQLTRTEPRQRGSRPARLQARTRTSRRRSPRRATRPQRQPTGLKTSQSTKRSSLACKARRRDLGISGRLRTSQRLDFAEGHRAPLGPGACKAIPQLPPQPGDGVVELDTVVGIRDRARFSEDAVCTCDKTRPALEVAVVDRQHTRVEKGVWPQVRVLMGEYPLARGAKAFLSLDAISAVQRDVHQVVVFARHVASLAEPLVEIAALEVQLAGLL